MPRWWLVLGMSIFPSVAAAAPELPRLSVAPSTVAAELLPLLREELGDAAFAADGPLRLVAAEERGALVIEMTRDRRKVLDRRFLLEGERVAAFRAAVLTIAEARRIEAGPPEPPTVTAPITPPPPPDPPSVWIGASFGSAWAGGAPQLGIDLVGAKIVGPLRVGAGVGLHGLGCCEASVAAGSETALSGDFLLFSARAEAEWLPIAFAGIEAGVGAAAGVELIQIDVSPAIFPGDDVPTRSSGWSAIGRGGAVIRGPILPWLAWAFRGGVEARSSSVGATLPEGFPTPAQPLAARPFAPYLGVGLEAGWF